MAMKVEIYQKDNVKPISPTPQSSRNKKLSILDQLVSTFYMPMVFFYDSHRHDDYNELKESLSRTMSVMPPLAGRLKDDGLSIECNDEGAYFVQANVKNYDLADVIQHPKINLIRQLLACDPYPTSFSPAQPLLAVQATRFRCGGTAVGICLWHTVLDGTGLVAFYQTWAAINRGEVAPSLGNNGLMVDPTSIFPPMKNIQISKSVSSLAEEGKRNLGKYCTKRFVFSKQMIERMREAYKQQSNQCRPTRVQTLSAFIWAAVIRATLQTNPSLKGHLLTNMVDLRNRMKPHIPLACLGNINHLTIATWDARHGGVVTAQSLIGSVRESIQKVTDDYVRKMHVNGGYIKEIIGIKNQVVADNHKVIKISSWCNFPFNTVDFGWGKPIFVCPGHHFEDLGILMDTNNGGVEAWIGLSREIMCNLDKDKEFRAHVLCSQVVSESPYLLTRL